MTDAGTLATTSQCLLAIGANASADQTLELNTNFWILMAESDMEKAFNVLGNDVGLVANYGSIPADKKQWLAVVASHRVGFYGINQNPDSWAPGTTQSKLAVCDSIWTGFLSDLKDNRSEIITSLGL